MRLQDVIKKSKGVLPQNIGDDDARYVFVARTTQLMLEDAAAGKQLQSARCYSIEAITWFNRVASAKPFRFQQLTSADGPGELIHRETFFRNSVRKMMDAVISGAVAQKRWTWRLVTELREAADRELSDFVLQPMSAVDEWGSEDFIQEIYAHLRKTRSFRSLPHAAEYQHFCEHGFPLQEHERRLQKAGLIARELCS
ncbi:MAG TPA: hypothetical protein VF662_06655 [Allosphingosinicella sp.]|jgi:hypothetical protein